MVMFVMTNPLSSASDSHSIDDLVETRQISEQTPSASFKSKIMETDSTTNPDPDPDPDPDPKKSQPQINTYHCICTTLLLATTHTLSSLPHRAEPALDKALILALPPASRLAAG